MRASHSKFLRVSLFSSTMGTQKKEKVRRTREGDTRAGNLRVKGENFYRDAKKVKHLQMYKSGRAVRNAKGEIVRAAALQLTDVPVARVDPNRKWFGNTRVIAQDALTHFREAMGDKKDDTYSVLLRRNKLPMSLLNEKDTSESPTAKIVETESYEHAFGPKQQRKKPRVQAASTLLELADLTEEDSKTYEEKQELDATLGLMGGLFLDKDDYTQEAKEAIFHKGQSKRIWNELYKVIDSSDVVIHVLDARNPLGTRCESVEKYIKEECSHKHLIYVLNKCDLVPTWVAVCYFFSLLFEGAKRQILPFKGIVLWRYLRLFYFIESQTILSGRRSELDFTPTTLPVTSLEYQCFPPWSYFGSSCPFWPGFVHTATSFWLRQVSAGILLSWTCFSRELVRSMEADTSFYYLFCLQSWSSLNSLTARFETLLDLITNIRRLGSSIFPNHFPHWLSMLLLRTRSEKVLLFNC